MRWIAYNGDHPSFEEIAAREILYLERIRKNKKLSINWFPIADGVEFSSALRLDGKRIVMSARNQAIAAELLKAELPSKDEATLAFKSARHIEPCTIRPLSASLEAVALCDAHYGCFDDLVDNDGGKVYLRDALPGRARTFGLVDAMNSGAKLRPNGLYMWQDSIDASGQHNYYHVDATQGCRFVRRAKTTALPKAEIIAIATKLGDDDRGDINGPVHTWQRYLESNGYDVGPIDGKHFQLTQAATEEWWGAPPTKPGVKKSIPFKQAKHYYKGRRRNIIGVCVHTAEMDLKSGAATALMNYAHNMPDDRKASWNYAVDHETETQSVLEEDTAFCAPGANETHIHIELCTWAKTTSNGWADEKHEALLDRAAKLTADICNRRGIPIEQRTIAEVKVYRPGVCGHVDVTKAFGKSTHTDPGKYFPWGAFMRKVRTYAAERG